MAVQCLTISARFAPGMGGENSLQTSLRNSMFLRILRSGHRRCGLRLLRRDLRRFCWFERSYDYLAHSNTRLLTRLIMQMSVVNSEELQRLTRQTGVGHNKVAKNCSLSVLLEKTEPVCKKVRRNQPSKRVKFIRLIRQSNREQLNHGSSKTDNQTRIIKSWNWLPKTRMCFTRRWSTLPVRTIAPMDAQCG